MTRDESIPIGTVSAEQIKQAREGAAALDLADIERRHEAAERAGQAHQAMHGDFIHADRGALLAALREARAEVERLRGALSRLADEYQHAGPVNGFVVARRLRLVAADMDRPAGTLASLDDACDGSDR